MRVSATVSLEFARSYEPDANTPWTGDLEIRLTGYSLARFATARSTTPLPNATSAANRL
jgi:hypothetical protein